MDKTNNLDIFMTDLADSIREATGETGSINAQSFSTRITGLGTGKQDKLVSGENIKTINGESILGSGDIEISGGSGGGIKYVYAPLSEGPSGKEVYFTLTTPFESNKVYVAKEAVSRLSLSPMTKNTDLIGEEYILMFQAAMSDFPITLSDDTFWANGIIPTIEAGTYYELSIVNIRFDTYVFNKAVLTPFKPVE